MSGPEGQGAQRRSKGPGAQWRGVGEERSDEGLSAMPTEQSMKCGVSKTPLSCFAIFLRSDVRSDAKVIPAISNQRFIILAKWVKIEVLILAKLLSS